MNNHRDLEIAKHQHWYRIPVRSADRFIPSLREMQYLAFYQTKTFNQDAYAVNYTAEIENLTRAKRIELLPDQPGHRNIEALYYKLEIAPLRRLLKPIRSQRLRRITFIPTTLEKLKGAVEINDLFHSSPLEDRIWEELKVAQIAAERQFEIREPGARYTLDFAIYCKDGSKINVECNGDAYHSTKAARDRDRKRNTYLTTHGWLVQRFGTDDIFEDLEGCIAQIRQLVDLHGGPEDRRPGYDLYRPNTDPQLKLFEGYTVSKSE